MIEKAIAFATQAHEGYPECGEELWNRFRMKDKNIIGWYYKSIRDVLANSLATQKAYQEYCDLVEKNFQ